MALREADDDLKCLSSKKSRMLNQIDAMKGCLLGPVAPDAVSKIESLEWFSKEDVTELLIEIQRLHGVAHELRGRLQGFLPSD